MYQHIIQWCDEHIAACKAQQVALKADFREDESAFMQARENIFGIFRSVINAWKHDPAELEKRLGSITSIWQDNLARCRRETDTAANEKKLTIALIQVELGREIMEMIRREGD